ncbi:MbcA/ParS/Xre antitoxin family protein [Pseudomonas sp. NPDC086251]|uniref:MbcA/ParS/Xre antitoxin family protein n=1 Tax=Pseudomonas sp. NPDC086251 TaxID=3364431 RepID=UPI003833D31A
MGEALFGEYEKVTGWLSKPKERCSGKSPITMLSTVEGTHQVKKMLVRLQKV